VSRARRLRDAAPAIGLGAAASALGLVTAALALVLAAALAIATAAGPAAAERGGATLRVFAAASLADAFGEIGGQFEKSHPGLSVELNLAGSQQLATQLEQGAAADVFASADERWMAYARERSLLAGEPAIFARNRLVVVIPRTNPARIGRLQDLVRRGIKLVIGAEAVPVGKYSREVLQNLSRSAGFEPEFSRRVLANVVSEEENVKSVLGKVQLGEADAGMVYRSDVTPALARFVRVIEIPDSANVLATYPIAVVEGSRRKDVAGEFVSFVLSPAGQRVLGRRGLIPARPPDGP
jgi:molybdate transport system substrate-binding protein